MMNKGSESAVRRKWRNPSFGLMLHLAVILCIACTGRSDEPAGQQTVFRYNESKGISTLDPAFARNQTIIWPVHQLFNGLVQMDDSLRLKPCIARSWTISENGTVYRFYLRNDVYFHDHPLFPGGKGRRVIAGDVVYSFNRILDPSIASPGMWIFSHVDHDRSASRSGFVALNDSTLEIRLKNPFPAFLGILSMSYCSVVPREIVEAYGTGFRNHPVGTGPFMFRLWEEGEKLVLVKNPRYFEKDENGQRLPYLDAVAITFVNDKQSEFLEFMKGNLDFLSGVHSAYKSELITRAGKLNARYHDRFDMITGPYLNTEYLGIFMDTAGRKAAVSPLHNIGVRKAINHAFDRVKMASYLRNNLASPALEGIVPEGLPSFTRSLHGYEYNPDLSSRLLAEAGYPGGKGLPEIVLTTTSDYLDICEFIQHELSRTGIRLAIEVSTGPVYRENVANGRLPFFRASWIADYPDAENYLALFCSNNFSPAGPNYTHYHNHTYDEMYEQALRESDDSLRFSLYRQMDQMILDEAVTVPLYYDKVVRFCPKNISGLGINPLNLLSLKKVKKLNP